MTEEQEGREGLINWSIALENASGDEALAIDLARTFLDEAPKLLAAIHLSLEQSHAALVDRSDQTWQYLHKHNIAHENDNPIQLLHRSAHTLKGGLRVFGSGVARGAERLESLVKNLADRIKPIDEQIRRLPDDPSVRVMEKRRLIEASGITASPDFSATLAEVPAVLANLEANVHRVMAALRERVG